MKLSKMAVSRINDVISQLDRGLTFIDQPKTHIVRETSISAGLSYTWKNGAGKEGVAIEKRVGSELCYLRNARDDLKQLITPPVIEQEISQ